MESELKSSYRIGVYLALGIPAWFILYLGLVAGGWLSSVYTLPFTFSYPSASGTAMYNLATPNPASTTAYIFVSVMLFALIAIIETSYKRTR
jgi:hypothetical protein